MWAKQAVISHLLSRMEITNLVATRIRPTKAAESEPKPYLVVMGMGQEPTYHAGGDAGFQLSEVRINCYGRTETEAAQLAEKVRLVTSGRPAGKIGSVFVRAIFVKDIRDQWGSPSSGDEIGYPCVAVDLDVWHSVDTDVAW